MSQNTLEPGRNAVTGLKKNSETDEYLKLVKPLKCMKDDPNYTETRKALEPTWNGIIPPGHNILEENCELQEANLITSQHRDGTNKHRIMLDMPNASLITIDGVSRLCVACKISSRHRTYGIVEHDLKVATVACKLTELDDETPKLHLVNEKAGLLEIDMKYNHYFYLSDFDNRYHLIIEHDITWFQYICLVDALAMVGAIEIETHNEIFSRRCAAQRPPWFQEG